MTPWFPVPESDEPAQNGTGALLRESLRRRFTPEPFSHASRDAELSTKK